MKDIDLYGIEKLLKTDDKFEDQLHQLDEELEDILEDKDVAIIKASNFKYYDKQLIALRREVSTYRKKIQRIVNNHDWSATKAHRFIGEHNLWELYQAWSKSYNAQMYDKD